MDMCGHVCSHERRRAHYVIPECCHPETFLFAGVRQDLTQAVAWYKIAAQQHNARAEAVMRLYEVLFPPLRARACKDV